MLGALWICFDVDLWKLKNLVIKVRLWLISKKHASREVLSLFMKKKENCYKVL